MSEYTKQLSAIEMIRYIANDYHELSHDKIIAQAKNWREICQEWLKEGDSKFNYPFDPPASHADLDLDF